jgi:hypothetical protein
MTQTQPGAATQDDELTEFMNEVRRMRELYSNQKFMMAEKLRDELAERLDDIMRIKLT